MTTIQQVTADLTSLLNESKRRNADIRQACDAALSALSNYSGKVDQLTPQDKSKVLSPFLISCNTGNARFANLGVPAIHKLIISNAIAPDDIRELLKALLEATHLAIDIQLRILQCLPSLMQNYNKFIKGDLLLNLLSICLSLTSNNKSTVVINTASATLQQLFTNIYDLIPVNLSKSELTKTVTIDNDREVKIDELSYEGFLIFLDLCRLIDHNPPKYFKELVQIKFTSALEIVESIIFSDKQLFRAHEELSYLLRIKLIPSLLRFVNNNSSEFPVIIRIMRIIQVLLSSQLHNLVIEGEIVLSILNHILLNNDSLNWEKYVVLEVFRTLFTDFGVIKTIFELYDQDPKKKNVIQELLSILSTFLQYNSFLIRESIKIPNNQTSEYLSKQHSTMKISILDLLDKTEPPINVPHTYPHYLIFNILTSATDGIAKFVQSLSNSENASNLENDIEFINSIITLTYPNMTLLLKYYIYSLMDSDFFHILIRSLQKYTHTTGLLGLNSLRDGLLTLLAEAIIKQDHATAVAEKGSVFQEQSKNLIALGESIVESFTGDTSSLSISEKRPEPQANLIISFNSRHITCLRALINLAISLGSTLSDSWKIIWITLQWCDYFMNGPNEYSSSKGDENFVPRLTQPEAASVSNSMNKFYESVSEYPAESYTNLIKSLINLFELEFEEANEDKPQGSLVACPYNKVYFINEIYNITKINPLKYLIEHEENFMFISDLFIKFGISKQKGINFNFKIYIISKFNSIVKNLTIESANNEDTEIFNKVSEISLGGLGRSVDALNEHRMDELLLINNKIEIHLTILDTLNEVIENYNKNLTTEGSWSTIFKIINNPFSFKDEELKKTSNENLNEKFSLLLNSAFSSLKLILNEFIVHLPTNKFKTLIDTLFRFCLQTIDLNISFSSISYFWLISDSIKSRFGDSTGYSKDIKVAEFQEDTLVQTIERGAEDDLLFYKCLDIYLLWNLIKLSGDHRAQVRDGSLQTFFEIIDIHGSLFDRDEWKLIFNIIFSKIFVVQSLESKELKETVMLKLDGMNAIYNKFHSHFTLDFWKQFLNLSTELVKLNNVEINTVVLEKFNDLLNISGTDSSIDFEFYIFWINFPVEYDFVTPDVYVECLTNLMKGFPQIYKKNKSIFDEEKVQTVLNFLSRCLRYPIILNKKDEIKATPLQIKILDNIRLIESDNDSINSLLVKELSNLLVYQFKVRERIEIKLGNSPLVKHHRLPTFISVGNLSFSLLKEVLSRIHHFETLIYDNTVLKLVKSLLDVIEVRAVGNDPEHPLWIECDSFLIETIKQLTQLESKLNPEIWQAFLRAIRIYLHADDKNYESINTQQYYKVTELILPHMKDPATINEFLSELYLNSLLYEQNEIEAELVGLHSIDQVIENLVHYDFDCSFGTTKPIVLFKHNKIRLVCLEQLIRFTNSDDERYNKAIDFFIARSAFTLRRLIEEERVNYRHPVSRIQGNELRLLLSGLYTHLRIGCKLSDHAKISNIVRLLIKLTPYLQNLRDVGSLVQEIMLEVNRTI